MATSSAALKSFEDLGVIVVMDFTKYSKSLPMGARRLLPREGGTIMLPVVLVTNADASEGIEGILNEPLNSDMKGVVRDLEKKLAKRRGEKGGTVSDEAIQSSRPGLLTDERAWTNAQGKEMRAAVKSLTDSHVAFVMPNGTVVNYPRAKLSAESQAILQALE